MKIQVYVYPFKCLVCRRTGKYSTAVDKIGDIDFRCPHDGSKPIFQEQVRTYTPSHEWLVTAEDTSNTIGDAFVDAVIAAMAGI